MKRIGACEGMLHRELTRSILGCAFDVINELGHGFLEAVYEKALMVALEDKGISAEPQKAIGVRFRGRPVGIYYADLIVEDKVLVELKAVSNLVPEHSAQVINYLNATGIKVGLLVNFGNSRLQYKRLTPTKS